MSSESETSESDISMFSETASSETNEWEELQALLHAQFPKCPFIIDCVGDLEALDTIFSHELVILIYDDRLNYKYGYADMSNAEQNKLRHYTVVKSINGNPIRLRQVLNTLIKDSHYNSRVIEKHFKRYCLEKIYKTYC